MQLLSLTGSRLTSVSFAFAIIMVSAFITRMVPFFFSDLPFNNDALIECGLASDIILNERLVFTPGAPWEGTHSADLPGFGVLLAFISSALGTSPLDCAQMVISVFSMVTVGAIFLLARELSGSTHGGIIASMAALLSGTFVFTTGSAWKLSLGFTLTVLLYLAFLRRDVPRYRLLTFGILCMLPFVHHLAAAVNLIALAFMLLWSWIVALSHSRVSRRLLGDTVTVLLPVIVATFYYSFALEDRQAIYTSTGSLVRFLGSFLMLSVIAFIVMNMRTHYEASFAPLVGGAIAVILLLDYRGLVFAYEASAPMIYTALIASTAALVTLAWYGTELIIMRRRRHMAVQLSLIVAPLTVIVFGIAAESTSLSLQFVYRTFDFLQVFIFLGIAVAFVDLRARRPRMAHVTCVVVTVCLVCSFPFGFFTGGLLGVRHDSQEYEIDSMYWLSEHADPLNLVSDERLAFMAHSTIWVEKRSYLPRSMSLGNELPRGYIYMVEDSWTTTGVNDFPNGLAVIDETIMDQYLDDGSVIYVGGPSNDRILVFTSTDCST